MAPGFTVWLTGRPRAGKTTLGRLLTAELMARGLMVEHLDGDQLRHDLSPDLGFSPAERHAHCLRAAYLAGLLNRHGVACVVGLVSPLAMSRREARRALGEFVEVHLDCPLEQAINRDRDGLYERALAGAIKDFTGLDAPYEEPVDPELRLPTHRQTPAQSLASVLDYLEAAGLAPPAGQSPAAGPGDAPAYTPEDERQVERRLKELGYL